MTTAPIPTPETWPVTMPGLDSDERLGGPDPANPRTVAAQLLDDVSRGTVPLGQVFGSADLPANLRQLATDALHAVGDIRKHVHGAVAQLDALARNDLLPPAGRDRLIRERKQLTEAAVNESDGRSSVAITLLEAGLTEAAMPSFPDGADRAEARDELKLLLDASDDPATTVRQLAAGTDQRLASLAAGTYAATYLRARGVPEDVLAATRTFAAQAALSSGDPKRAAAARALVKLADIKKLRMRALNAASFAIEWNT